MKSTLMSFVFLIVFTLGYSQTNTIQTTTTDTTKSTTSPKKRLVKMNGMRVNAIQAGPVIRSNDSNANGKKEDETTTPPQ